MEFLPPNSKTGWLTFRRSHPVLGSILTRLGARVAPQRCPILRAGTVTLALSDNLLEAPMTLCYHHEDISKESKPGTFLKSSDKPQKRPLARTGDIYRTNPLSFEP